jgi:predicted CopG family antitoxin
MELKFLRVTGRKDIVVEEDIWYQLTMLKLKNNKIYKSINDVIKALLDEHDQINQDD